MRNRLSWLSLTALFVLLSLPVLANTPIATVTCGDSFVVDGRAVAPSGITAVPLAVGSEVATDHTPAVLFFADGSSVKLAASSRAKIVGSEAQPKLVLLAGSLDYKVVLGSNLSVTSLDLERKSQSTARAVAAHPAKVSATAKADDALLSVSVR